MSFPARRPGRCGLCDERVHEGDLLRPARQGELSSTTFVHDVCPDDPADVADARPPCTVCWLVHPEGACDRG